MKLWEHFWCVPHMALHASRGLCRMWWTIKEPFKTKTLYTAARDYTHCGTLTLQSSVCIQKPSDQPHWSRLLQIGVVHRDLKLENILLDEDMNVKVTLFFAHISSVPCSCFCFYSLPRGRGCNPTLWLHVALTWYFTLIFCYLPFQVEHVFVSLSHVRWTFKGTW